MKTFTASAVMAGFSALGVAIAAQVTHIVICIENRDWMMLIAGVVIPPAGVIHGVGHWFGAW